MSDIRHMCLISSAVLSLVRQVAANRDKEILIVDSVRIARHAVPRVLVNEAKKCPFLRFARMSEFAAMDSSAAASVFRPRSKSWTTRHPRHHHRRVSVIAHTDRRRPRRSMHSLFSTVLFFFVLLQLTKGKFRLR